MRHISLAIIDNQPLVRWALNEYLSYQNDIKVVGEYHSFANALRDFNKIKPDIVIIETKIYDCDINIVVSQMRNLGITKVLAYSEVDNWNHVNNFIAAGGMGYISKRSQLDELLEAIRAIDNNQIWISPSLRSSSELN